MWRVLTLLLTLQTVFAQFLVTTDKSTYSAGDTMKISWSVKSDTVLNLKDQDVGQVLLCTCNSTDSFGCKNMKNEIPVSDKSVSIAISDIATLGPDGSYLIQFATKNSKKPTEYALAYLDNWFKITGGMTGSGKAVSDTCQAGGDQDNGVPGTASSVSVSWPSYTLPASLSTVSGYAIPYTWQKGPTRTAPFQSTPGTKVTKTSTPSRRNPTSSWSAFKSYFKNKYMPMTTETPGPVSQAFQSENMVVTVATTPSGRRATRIMPTLSIAPTSSASGGSHGRRRRWAD